jgi:hypothetical protein
MILALGFLAWDWIRDEGRWRFGHWLTEMVRFGAVHDRVLRSHPCWGHMDDPCTTRWYGGSQG